MRYFRLIRWPNLVLTLITQFVFYWHVSIPVFAEAGIQQNLHLFSFLILLLGTLGTMAGGYILNDLKDQLTDSINRGSDIIIGKSISRRSAWSLYILTLFVSLLTCAYFMLQGMYYTGLAIVSSLIALYGYSSKLKGTPILGNLLIAGLSSLVIIILWLSESPWRSGEPSLVRIKHIFMSFGLFAFLSTLIREIVKDMEDLEGDHKSNISTIATVWGISNSIRVALAVSIILLFSIVFTSAVEWARFSLFGKSYAVVLTMFLIAIMVQISRSTESRDFAKISRVLKIFMAAGLFFVIFWNV
ncbi:MAG: geranylgeranylglycerol-phosphate geranylgeranyltransferase [Saprospiraceae bacterium]|nr:geranylgeranylglycerol-phosphate geranylgeranyltransferase [Saprospiraceae bacterium]